MTTSPILWHPEPEPVQQYPIVPVADLQAWAATVRAETERLAKESGDGG